MTGICELFGLSGTYKNSKQEGHKWPYLVGLEMEVENWQNMNQYYDGELPDISPWSVHSDDSLRNGSEFVLTNPLSGTALEEALDVFFNQIPGKHTSGPRTSTHIHINMQDATVEQVRVMFVIMYTLEHSLYHVVGQGRKWGGYSMALSEMEHDRLRRILIATDARDVRESLQGRRNNDRYYGLNTASLQRHGTAEFRYFAGGLSKEELCSYIDFVTSIKTLSLSADMQTLLDINSCEELRAMLGSFLSQEWMDNIKTYTSDEDLFEFFGEVMAITADNDVRFLDEDPPVVLKDALMKFVLANVVKSADGRRSLLQLYKDHRVMSSSAWRREVTRAQRADIPEKERVEPRVPSRLIDDAFGNPFESYPGSPANPLPMSARRSESAVGARDRMMSADRIWTEAAARIQTPLNYPSIFDLLSEEDPSNS
jgi:hypothetical protein